MKKIMVAILCLTFVCMLCACGDKSPKDETEGQHLLDEFFVTIGTDIKRADINDIAKNMGLYIDHANSGVGTYTYRVAADKDVANTYHPEKGSYVTVCFNALEDDAITEITYFDENRMVAGYWNPYTGYLLADYNYPQIVYHDEDADEVYSRTPVSDAKEIIEYSFDGELGENLLETLFASITSETTKYDLLTFVDEHGLSYNSRGAGNYKVISYCHEIGRKYGEEGSYIILSVDSDKRL